MARKVFISSTSQDLGTYRGEDLEERTRLGMLPVVVKFWEAMANDATAGSKRKLDDAGPYVGAFAQAKGRSSWGALHDCSRGAERDRQLASRIPTAGATRALGV